MYLDNSHRPKKRTFDPPSRIKSVECQDFESQVMQLTRAFIVSLLVLTLPVSYSAQCSSVTPTFTLDLSGAPNSSSSTPVASRNGTCCGGSVPCVKIVVILHPNAMALELVPTGADPGGSLTYEFNCNGIQYPGGSRVCLSGTGPQTLTICKVGNNPNSYSVSSYPRATIPDSIFVRNGCQHTLAATGFSLPTIQWGSVPSNTLYNSYLSCTTGCSLTVVTPSGTPPPYVDYEVSGYGAAPCGTNFYRDTVRVHFYGDLSASINPQNPTICYGSTDAVLTVTASGGKPPYTYSWTTGSSAQTVTVGVGNYSVTVYDNTGCPPVTATSAVNAFTLPIEALAGPDIVVCKTSTAVALSGSVVSAPGGSWTAPGGSFSPGNSVLNPTFFPTPAQINSGSAQLILETTGNSGCPPDQDTLLVIFQNQPTVVAIGDPTVCANNNIAMLTATVFGYTATPVWTALGGGTVTPMTGAVTSFSPSPGQIAAGTASIVVSTINNGACAPHTDTALVYISPAPVTNAGNTMIICSNGFAQLQGSVTAAAFSGSWTSSGDGTFGNSSSLITTYTPGVNDISTGTVNLILTSTNNGNCIPVKDTVTIYITKMATVTASAPSQICSTASFAAINGIVTGAAGTASWSSSGTGNFDNSISLQTNYNFSNADLNGGFITFSLTSTGNGVCPAVTAVTSISVAPLATVNAGTNLIFCASQNSFALTSGQPTITSIAQTGSWTTSGSGTLTGPQSYTLSQYHWSTSDMIAGTITFTLTSTNNGICPQVSDTVTVRIISDPTIQVIPSQTLCASNGSAALSGTITGGTGTSVTWTSNGQGSFSDNVSLHTNYIFASADISGSPVIFTLTTVSNGPCAAQHATTALHITTPATVIAGPPQLICASQTSISLSGTVTGAAASGSWSSSGSGSFSTPQSTSSTYSVSENDILNGTVVFTLTSTNNGPCAAAFNTTSLQITPQPSLQVSSSVTVCSTSPSAAISGTVSGGSSTASWSSVGNGTFFPTPAALSSTYILDGNEVTAGIATVTLTSSGHAPCPAITRTIHIHVNYPAVITSGGSQTICSSQGTAALNGTVISAAGTGTWSTSGGGIFFPVNSAATNYSLSNADIVSGNLLFTIHSTNNGACPVSTNTMMLSIVREPTVRVSASQTLCVTSGTAILSASITGHSTNGQWTSSGDGQFQPSNTAHSPSYVFGNTEVNGGPVKLFFTSTGNSPCSEDSDTLTLSIQSPATVNPGTYSPICSTNNLLNLNGSVTGGLQTGIWSSSGTGQFIPDMAALNATYQISQQDILTGSINFTLSSTNNGACSADVKTTSVQIVRQPSVLAVPDMSICSNQPEVTLQSTVAGEYQNISWSTTGMGAFSTLHTTSTTYSVASGDIQNSPVFFIVSLNPVQPCEIISDTVRLHITPRPIVTVTEDTIICANQNPLHVNSTILGGTGEILWITTGTGSFSPGNFVPDVDYYLSEGDIAAGNIQLSVNSTNNGACGEVSASMLVTILPSPAVDFAASQYTVTLPEATVSFSNQTVGGQVYEWQSSDGNNASTFHFSNKYRTVGFYTVSLASENEYGCRDSVQKIIAVISNVKFPTAFTPNGDKLNDVFLPYTDGVVEYEMNIYNRWGERIFQSTDIRKGWDGMFNGKLCQQDVYVWAARVVFFDGRIVEETGTVTLIR